MITRMGFLLEPTRSTRWNRLVLGKDTTPRASRLLLWRGMVQLVRGTALIELFGHHRVTSVPAERLGGRRGVDAGSVRASGRTQTADVSRVHELFLHSASCGRILPTTPKPGWLPPRPARPGSDHAQLDRCAEI